MTRSCQVVIVGAGHAGCEAALACARMQLDTIVLTGSLTHVARMPCNPSIGGPAKAHLVREVDALGGEMARVIDRTHLHIRMLNTGKGPAVQALRAQAHRPAYSEAMHDTLRNQERVTIIQDLVLGLLTREDRVVGVVGSSGCCYQCEAVVLTTGTFLGGQIHMGMVQLAGGRSGEPPAVGLSACLKSMGLHMGRLKTGTTPRVHRDTIDFGALERIGPSLVPLTFSEISPRQLPARQLDCYLTRTTSRTREVILANLHLSPLFGGQIQGTGPRYCPSIEDKVVRFPERETHQVWIEPEGFDVPEVYLQGVSTSLPLEVQHLIVRSLPGLEQAVIIRPGYAVEYDYVLPTQLHSTLESRAWKGLFLAGQINGTSGYEEAAAQGILAGINAALRAGGGEPIVIGRDQGYLGVLVDDLVCRGTTEPYRMHTSRAEYRLLLRQDNADQRLTPLGRQVGLVDHHRWSVFETKQKEIETERSRLQNERVSGNVSAELSEWMGQSVQAGQRLEELVARPGFSLARLRSFQGLPELDPLVVEQVEISFRYQGYLRRQQAEVERLQTLEARTLPLDLDYANIASLSAEAREKLEAVRPATLGQASRVPGISPSDLSLLMVMLKQCPTV